MKTKKKPKKPSKTSLMKKADALYSAHRRNQVGKCEQCGKKENLNLCHIISRDCKKLRYSDENTIVMCWSCHFIFHRKPLHFSAFVDKIKGHGAGKLLIQESNNLSPIRIEYYQGIIDKYKI